MKEELKEYAKGLGAKKDILQWIDKRILGNESVNEVEHCIDYLIQKEEKLDRQTFKQIRKKSEKWSKQLHKKGKDIKETSDDVEVIIDFKDGFKIVKLIGENAFKREGLLMRHCVASYFGKDTEIYSLRDGSNMPHCTIEKDVQIKGKGNGEIHPKYIDYVVKFLEYTGMKVRDSEMSNLGYIVPDFKEYVVNTLYKGRYIRKTEEIIYRDDVIIFNNIKDAVKYTGDKICCLKGCAYFKGSNITSLGKLTSIGGGAYFKGSNITDLGKLTSIGGGADFENSKIKSLGKLTSIGGYADFRDSNITSLGKLTSIGGNADFRDSNITDLGKLTSIGGYADFENSNITDLGNLTSIGGGAYFKGSNITSLGKLTSIGGNADFDNEKLEKEYKKII